MLDCFDLPSDGKIIDRIKYTSFSPAAGANWQVWNKPRGATWIYLRFKGAGGGGGGGFVGAAAAAGGGGGGGGAGSVSMMIPAFLCPDKLWISLGIPGKGGPSGAAGSDAIASYISLVPTTAANVQIAYTSTAASGGSAGRASGAAGLGAGAVATSGLTLIGTISQAVVAPVNGGAGGTATTNGAGGTVFATASPTTGGGGGGAIGTTGPGGNGGDIGSVSTLISPILIGGRSTGPYGGINGISEGKNLVGSTIISTGGSGGAGGYFDGTTLGGNGGHGGEGCGGGGGGASLTGKLAGSGGNGGIAICEIVAF